MPIGFIFIINSDFGRRCGEKDKKIIVAELYVFLYTENECFVSNLELGKVKILKRWENFIAILKSWTKVKTPIYDIRNNLKIYLEKTIPTADTVFRKTEYVRRKV